MLMCPPSPSLPLSRSKSHTISPSLSLLHFQFQIRLIVKWTTPSHQALSKGGPSSAESMGGSRAVAALYQSDSGEAALLTPTLPS